jgi:hypothetical protein
MSDMLQLVVESQKLGHRYDQTDQIRVPVESNTQTFSGHDKLKHIGHQSISDARK